MSVPHWPRGCLRWGNWLILPLPLTLQTVSISLARPLQLLHRQDLLLHLPSLDKLLLLDGLEQLLEDVLLGLQLLHDQLLASASYLSVAPQHLEEPIKKHRLKVLDEECSNVARK